jgi:prephenate dehydrogenase
MIDFSNMNITVVGLGMEGGSYAIALRNYLKPNKLWGVDKNSDVIKAAEYLSVIDEGFTNPSFPLKNSDIVILCIYPKQIAAFIEEHNNLFKKGCVVTDVAGVKKNMIEKVEKFIRDDIDYVPGHPMAGNEYKGFLYADKDIFKNTTYLILPREVNSKKSIETVELLAKKIGSSKVYKTDPVTHDEMIAYASQLIHVVAAAIVNNENYSEDIDIFSGGSFKSATRVANINSDLWTDAFFENKENLVKELEHFKDNIEEFINALKNNDEAKIYNLLELSHKKKNEFKNKFNNY